MPGAPVSEQVALPFIVDEALARIYAMLNVSALPALPFRVDESRTRALWTRLPAQTRVTWLHAARLDGGFCLSVWQGLSTEERASLMLALEGMVEFLQKVGESGPAGSFTP